MRKTNALEIVGMITIVFCLGLALWINLIAEPRCQEKGYAGASDRGCWIIKDGVRVYEDK